MDEVRPSGFGLPLVQRHARLTIVKPTSRITKHSENMKPSYLALCFAVLIQPSWGTDQTTKSDAYNEPEDIAKVLQSISSICNDRWKIDLTPDRMIELNLKKEVLGQAPGANTPAMNGDYLTYLDLRFRIVPPRSVDERTDILRELNALRNRAKEIKQFQAPGHVIYYPKNVEEWNSVVNVRRLEGIVQEFPEFKVDKVFLSPRYCNARDFVPNATNKEALQAKRDIETVLSLFTPIPEAEKTGAGQPSTKPADKVPANDQGSSKLEKAYLHFRRAAENGNIEAQFQVGECLLYGNGIPQDSREAVNWFLKASTANHSGAQFAMAECYRSGYGVEQDYSKSFDWYRKAADQGNCEAIFNIGVCYDYGIGTSEDKAKAFECYKNASEKGHVESQYHLGFAYANGRGVHKSNILAYMWLDVAGEAGFRTASEYRDEIADSMSQDAIADAKKLIPPLKKKLAAGTKTSP